MATTTTPPARPHFLDGMTSSEQARVAMMRFGMGPRRNQDPAIWTTPYAAYDQCIRELDAPWAATINDIDMDPAGENYRLLLTAQEAAPFASGERACGFNFAQERRARYAKHMLPRVGFVERLVLFWMNHFNMFLSTNPTVHTFMGVTERNIIRANALGRFETMLLGMCQSPAMLTYLDGRNSTRANTNQNFAREILELHTLGSSADYSPERSVGASQNYSQRDVENLAKILTGWGVKHDSRDDPYLVPSSLLSSNREGFRTFTFKPQHHVNGPQTVLGTRYTGTGVDQGIAVLKDLAAHTLTADHIARKLLCHFVTETPSEASVRILADTFRSTKGNLKEVARALLNLEEAWTAPLERLRQPYPWFISIMRAMGIPALALTNVAVSNTNITFQDCIDDGISGYLRIAGQQPWHWRTPDGSPDRDAYWLNGNALQLRANVAYSFLKRLTQFPLGTGETLVTTHPDVPDGSRFRSGTIMKRVPQSRRFAWTPPSAVNLVRNAFGGTLSAETSTGVTQLARTDNMAALVLLFSSPEYLLS